LLAATPRQNKKLPALRGVEKPRRKAWKLVNDGEVSTT